MQITVETVVIADLNTIWRAWTDPGEIKQWNAASDDWHTTKSTVDLREGGAFSSRMEAKDGSEGFDSEGTYTRIVPQTLIEYRLRHCAPPVMLSVSRTDDWGGRVDRPRSKP